MNKDFKSESNPSQARALLTLNPDMLLKELQAPLTCKGPMSTCQISNCTKMAMRVLAATSKLHGHGINAEMKNALRNQKDNICKTMQQNHCPEYKNVCDSRFKEEQQISNKYGKQFLPSIDKKLDKILR